MRHIEGHNFAALIEAALSAPGFASDAPAQWITVGFGHNAVLGVADKVIDAVKSGSVRHFFLIGGCCARERRGDPRYVQASDLVADARLESGSRRRALQPARL